MRPIVEIMTVNFSLLALDQIVNNAATLRHMSGGQFNVPLVIRMATGGGRQLAAQHSHSLEGWYAHIPGLRVWRRRRWRMRAACCGPALQDPDPVLIFEHALLYNWKASWPPMPAAVDIDRAAVRRAGRDVTLITYGGSLGEDPRGRRSAGRRGHRGRGDRPAHAAPARRRHHPRLGGRRRAARVIVDEGWKSGSLAAEVCARIVEGAFYELDAPVARVCSAEVPMPYAKHLEDAALPQASTIAAAATRMLRRG